jgi:protein-tyrosine phosphatase
VQPELFRISRNGPGQLATMACPRGGRQLADELAGLARAGVGVLVSLLTDAEMTELGLAAEETVATAAGLDFLRLPTPDLAVPDPMGTKTMAGMLVSRLAGGAGVAVHCRAGVGRSSTLAAAVLVYEGTAPGDAWDLIAAARGTAVPDTPAQRAFIERLAGVQPAASPYPPS